MIDNYIPIPKIQKQTKISKDIYKFFDVNEPIDLRVIEDIFTNKFVSLEDILKNKTFYSYTTNLAKQKIRNKLGRLSPKQEFFQKAQQYAWQEAFVLEEKNRLIYALDVNSQFPYTMTCRGYTNPKGMIEIRKPNLSQILQANNGIIRVSFRIEDEWFAKTYPKYFTMKDGRKYFNYEHVPFIWMHLNEFKEYEKYLNNITISHIIYSKQDTEHPLKALTEIFYEKRQQYKGTIYEKIIKKFLVALHSATNPQLNPISKEEIKKKISKAKFEKNQRELLEYGYIVKEPEDLEYINIDQIKKGQYYTIPSLTSEIYSKSRLIIFELMEELIKNFKDVKICYTNIDSLHFSFPKEQKELMDNFLKPYISKELGKFKLEAVGEIGFWFSPARYFILDRDYKIVKAVNTILNDNSNLLNTERTINAKGLQGSTHSITNSAYDKIIKGNEFHRYNFSQYIDINTIYNNKKIIDEKYNKLKSIVVF